MPRARGRRLLGSGASAKCPTKVPSGGGGGSHRLGLGAEAAVEGSSKDAPEDKGCASGWKVLSRAWVLARGAGGTGPGLPRGRGFHGYRRGSAGEGSKDRIILWGGS